MARVVRHRRARLDGAGRVSGVDLARGLAVFGMLAAHLLDTPDLVWRDPSTWSGLVDGRSSILFALLAGVSLSLSTRGSSMRGPARFESSTRGGAAGAEGAEGAGGSSPVAGAAMALARRRLAVRAVAIWAVGMLLVALGTPVLVILPAYGILFLLALPALRWTPSALFAAAGAIVVAAPFALFVIEAWPLWQTPAGRVLEQATGWHYPFPLWAGFVLAGMGIGRVGVGSIRTALALVAAGSAAAVVGYGVLAPWGRTAAPDGVWAHALDAAPHSGGVAEAIGSGGFAVAVLGVALLLCATPARWIVWPLRAVGSMPLTAYAGQLVAWALLQPEPTPLQLGSDLIAFRALEPFWPFALGTAAFCTLWALVVGRGPLEAALSRLATTVVPASAARGGMRSPSRLDG